MCGDGGSRFLPELPILEIFRALPLSKLLKTHRVCPRFASLQNEALSKRTTFTLFISAITRELFESELFFEKHLDTQTNRDAEKAEVNYSPIEVGIPDDAMGLLG